MIVQESKRANLTFVTLSDVGTAHQAFNQPNQDSADFREADGDFVLAVSDGVGSCKYADRGSKAVIDSCISTFNTLKTCSLCFDSRQVAQNIWTEWQSILAGENLDDCCATVKAAFKYGNSILLVSVGDGFCVFSSESRQIATESFETTFLNETDCLNSTFSPEYFCCKEIPLEGKPYVVACCTDGFSNGIEADKELEFVKELESGVSASELRTELESFVNAISKASFDDKSIGVAKYEK